MNARDMRTEGPPAINLDTPPLFTPDQIGGASFFAGPMAGFWLLALNFHDLGKPRVRNAMIGWGAVFTALFLVVAFAVPSFPTVVMPIVLLFGMRWLAQQLEGGAIGAHFVGEGPKRPLSMAVIITLATAAGTSAITLLLMLIFDWGFWRA